MRLCLDGLFSVTGSYGISIILLSLIVKIITSPISAIARRAEERDVVRRDAMAEELAAIRASSTGRERFERTEELYQRHNYHPIKSAASVLPLFLQIPFLLSALLLLSHYYPQLAGQSFLFLHDLSQPDGLAAGINVLPLLITAIALIESVIKVGSTRSARLRFLIVALVIVVLIYPAPAGVCLYWLSSNVWSLLQSLYQRARAPVVAPAQV